MCHSCTAWLHFGGVLRTVGGFLVAAFFMEIVAARGAERPRPVPVSGEKWRRFPSLASVILMKMLARETEKSGSPPCVDDFCEQMSARWGGGLGGWFVCGGARKWNGVAAAAGDGEGHWYSRHNSSYVIVLMSEQHYTVSPTLFVRKSQVMFLLVYVLGRP